MKKFILLLSGTIATLICIFGIISLFVILLYSEFKQGKLFVITIFLLAIAGFGFTALKCFKSITHSVEIVQKHEITNSSVANISTHTKEKTVPITPVLEVNIIHQEVPQETLNSMKESYTEQQAVNDMRIIDESLAIMQKTSDIDTFLSRYDTAMRYSLTLEQAKKVGIPIALNDEFSQSLTDAKDKALASVLYRSFKKELYEIDKLKTDQEKFNRINKYQKKLSGMYEDVFEFVAEDAYNDVMEKLEFLKGNLK